MVQPPWNNALSTDRTDAELLSQFLSHTDSSAEAAFAALVERHGPIVRGCVSTSSATSINRKTRLRPFSWSFLGKLDRSESPIPSARGCTAWPFAWHGTSGRMSARRRAAERQKAEIMHQRDHGEFGAESMDYAELHDEIDRLPDKYRHPIILCYIQGRTQPEAAQLLGWPLGTVQTRLHRGRERLRSRLSRSSFATIALSR